MSLKTIEIDYNIDYGLDDVKRIIAIQYQIIYGSEKEYVIYFKNCKFINAAVSVVIGTIPVYARQLGKNVYIKFEDECSHVLEFMKSVGMYKFFDNKYQRAQEKERAIPFGRIENDDIMEKYTDKIIKLAPIVMNEGASDILSSYFFEIYQNSFSHANSPIDVFSCGYWMKNELFFSIYDMGIGIPVNVRQYVDGDMTSEECVRWAFEEGNTTLDETIIKRGLGLSRIEKFIRLNHGTMAMYTDDVFYIVDGERKETGVLKMPIKGTLIIIRIKADDKHIYVVDSGKEK